MSSVTAAAFGFAVLATALTMLVLPRGLALLQQAAFTRANYRGEAVPTSAGIIIAFIYASVLVAWQTIAPSPVLQAMLFVTVAMSLVGFADDVLGDKSTQGLRGHVRMLLRGRLSTGGLKAVFGIVVGIGAALPLADGRWAVAVGAATIALSSNAVNLLDLRPGRAVKGAVLMGVGLYAVSADASGWAYALPLLAALVVYAPYDLRAKSMLGDAGSNAVGGVLGVAAFASLSSGGRVLWAGLLIALHLLAERGSISRTIERVPVLKRIDEWGRD